MKRFLFRFGYCTPAQRAANEAHGWDDESSGAFLVEADNAEEALDWGRIVADAFVTRQFEATGRLFVRWADDEFASWIEHDLGVFESDFLRELPQVALGELPDFCKAPWVNQIPDEVDK